MKRSINRPLLLAATGFLFVCVLPPLEAQTEFRKIRLTERYYCDGVATGDIDGNGHPDVVAGPFWYAGPSFQQAHEFYPAEPLVPEDHPSNSMFSFVHDFSGDGRLDILVLGRVHKHAAYWYENPGNKKDLWKKHYAFERVRGESPMLVDIDKDDSPELITHWDGAWGWIEPQEDPAAPWKFHAIEESRDWPQFYHGQGVGDINGDGRLDLVINDGWYEHPEATRSQHWRFHQHKFSHDRGGAQMYVMDVDNDGDSDVISALNGHGWGLAWFEQQQEGKKISFVKHRMMGDRSEEQKFGVAFSQVHALTVADVDGNGLNDIVTGKRMWAHGPTGDVEPNAPPVVYWFGLIHTPDGVRWTPHKVDGLSGVGVQVATADLNADGRPDILTASKLGTFVFLSHRK